MTTGRELTLDDPVIATPQLEENRSSGRTKATSSTRTRTVLIVSSIASLAWITAVAMSAFRGFDITDEGYYVLSYRWWSENRQTFTGAQYVYGPVFDLLGHDIVRLRLFSLITVVATHVAFGWSFMRWLRVRRPDADPSPLWEWAGTATIVASGGIVYSWLPLSPGYNVISLLTAMLAAAVLLRAAVVPKTWLPLLLGPVVVAGMLAKWGSAALTFAAVAALTIHLLRRAAIRFFLLALLSTVVTLLLVQLFVVPLTDAIPQIVDVNRTVAAGPNAPTALLSLYSTSTLSALYAVVRDYGALLIAVFVTTVARRRREKLAATALTCLGFGVAAWALIAHHGLQGDTAHTDQFPIGPIAMVFAALIGGRFRDRPMIGLLLLLPVLQAAGTGNPIYWMAINGFALWMAVIIYGFTSVTERAPRRLMGSVAVLACAVSVTIGVTGVLKHPHRTSSYAQSTVMTPGLGVRLAPSEAAVFTRLRTVLRRYITPAGRPIMAFDEMPGIVYLLDGTSVGEAWYSGQDRVRTANGIEKACHGGWRGRAPLLIFNRPVKSTDISALQSCGFDFRSDYKLFVPRSDSLGVVVYVPVRSS